MKKVLFVIGGLLLLAVPVSAQVTNLSTNPTVYFNTPDTWNDVDLNGQPKITGIQVDVMLDSGGALAWTRSYPKPTAANGALVTLPIPELRNLSVNTVYHATVTTTGNGDPGVSAPSNPFGIIVQTPLGRVVNVVVN